jgi:hypothetical protein
MYGVVDFRGTQEATTGGYPGLLALARQLLGEQLLFARRGYPDELKLHLGTPVLGVGPKGKTLTRGSYVLSAVASAWTFKLARLGITIYSGDPFAPYSLPHQSSWVNPLSEEKLDEYLASTGGVTVVAVEVFAHPFGYALSLALSDGSVLTILPTPDVVAQREGHELPAVPDWELFTPYNRYLQVGPGPKWAYLPSDQPERAAAKPAG